MERSIPPACEPGLEPGRRSRCWLFRCPLRDDAQHLSPALARSELPSAIRVEVVCCYLLTRDEAVVLLRGNPHALLAVFKLE